ncbi:hypothetical protein VARIO8X_70001 [Burkholderiales bacterium 8X]|nr:hypothetical protein VARIO8X_70001 [Burkholderiales bacterium 8X]
MGQRVGQARAMGSMGVVDAHPAAVGDRGHLARAAGQAEQPGSSQLVGIATQNAARPVALFARVFFHTTLACRRWTREPSPNHVATVVFQ